MEKVKTLANRCVTSVGIFSMMLATTINTSFAAKKASESHYTITDNFITIFNNIRDDLIKFSSAAAAVCIIVCLLTLVFVKNERAVQMAWDWLKRIIICYVCIISIVSLISFAEGFKF